MAARGRDRSLRVSWPPPLDLIIAMTCRKLRLEAAPQSPTLQAPSGQSPRFWRTQPRLPCPPYAAGALVWFRRAASVLASAAKKIGMLSCGPFLPRSTISDCLTVVFIRSLKEPFEAVRAAPLAASPMSAAVLRLSTGRHMPHHRMRISSHSRAAGHAPNHAA